MPPPRDEDQLLTRADDDRQQGIEIRLLLDAQDEPVVVDQRLCMSHYALLRSSALVVFLGLAGP